MQRMTIKSQTLHLIGVPMDLGAGRRGVDMGPSAIRIAGVSKALRALGHKVIDEGDLHVPSPEVRDPKDTHARYLQEILQTCEELSTKVQETLANGEVPVILGGDHSIAIGSVSGVAAHYRKTQQQKIGVIWIDAHADMNTPDSSPTGNIHGMPLATLLGIGAEPLVNIDGFQPKLDPAHVCLIGIRNLDENEKVIVRKSGIHAYTMREVDERGMSAVMKEALEFTTQGTAGVHVSFDLDGMDPAYAPGVGTAVHGGINWREANLLMEMVYDTGKMLSVEITELNPIFDMRNQSGEVSVELLSSVFGKSIL